MRSLSAAGEKVIRELSIAVQCGKKLKTHHRGYFFYWSKLLYSAVLVPAIQGSESIICMCLCKYICMHAYIPFLLHLPSTYCTFLPHVSSQPLWVTTEHQAQLPELYNRFPLASYLTHDSILEYLKGVKTNTFVFKISYLVEIPCNSVVASIRHWFRFVNPGAGVLLLLVFSDSNLDQTTYPSQIFFILLIFF